MLDFIGQQSYILLTESESATPKPCGLRAKKKDHGAFTQRRVWEVEREFKSAKFIAVHCIIEPFLFKIKCISNI